MWPEKITAIYDQARFSWLRKILSPEEVERAYIKRFEEGTLDLSTEKGLSDCRNISLYLVSVNGESLELGVWKLGHKWLTPFRLLKNKYVETVREGLRRWSDSCSPSYVVVVRHHNRNYEVSYQNVTEITIFRPPQGEISLLEWYGKQVKKIEQTLAVE